MTSAVDPSLHQEAVAHAALAARAGEQMWRHITSEYSQDPDTIVATLATDAPLAWTLATDFAADGSVRFLTGTTVAEIRAQYAMLRTAVEIQGWSPLLEIRQGWYTMTHGVSNLRVVATGEISRGETVTMFPVGVDGVLGELQVGTVGRLPAGHLPTDAPTLPTRRLSVLAYHDAYIDALRAADVERVVAAHSGAGSVAIRSYLTDESTLLNATDLPQLAAYFSALFERYRVVELALVNRVVETWYVFAELHWTVEERAGAGRRLQFCTAEIASLDEAGKYWIRTGGGTDPVEA